MHHTFEVTLQGNSTEMIKFWHAGKGMFQKAFSEAKTVFVKPVLSVRLVSSDY